MKGLRITGIRKKKLPLKQMGWKEKKSIILVSSLLAKVLESAKFGLVTDTDYSKKRRRYFRTLPLSSK